MKTINDLKEKLEIEIERFDRVRAVTADAAGVLWLSYGVRQDWLRLAQPWSIESESVSRRTFELLENPYRLTIRGAVVCDSKQGKYKKATVTFFTYGAGEVIVSAYDADGKVVASTSRKLTCIHPDAEPTVELSVASGFSTIGVSTPGFMIYDAQLEE